MPQKFPKLSDDELCTVLHGMREGRISDIMEVMTGKPMAAIYMLTPRAIQKLAADAMSWHVAGAVMRSDDNAEIRELILRPLPQ